MATYVSTFIPSYPFKSKSNPSLSASPIFPLIAAAPLPPHLHSLVQKNSRWAQERSTLA